MIFSDLVASLGGRVLGGPNPEVLDVVHDARQAVAGSVYVARKGARVDGHRFVADLPAGSAALVTDPAVVAPDGVACALVMDAREALAAAASRVHGDPTASLPVVGVTGTNGKTTVTWLLAHAVARATDRTTGYAGTLGITAGASSWPSSLTTPEPSDLQRACAALVAQDGVLMALEASSIGLVTGRMAGVHVHTAVFTMLGRDHLDHHGTMAAYTQAKASLFQRPPLRSAGGMPRAILCADDPAWAQMEPPADRWTYGVDPSADVRVVDWTPGWERSTIAVEGVLGAHTLATPALGRYNALNVVAAWMAGVSVGVDPSRLAQALADTPLPPGRMARVPDARGRRLLVDYAHTPDALEAVLRAVRTTDAGRVFVVFGCGGDRDPGKRAPMGAVATACADRVWITSDNPRSEDPQAIASAVAEGAPGATVLLDREAAIRNAVAAAGPGDVVVVAGKGHETTQIQGGVVRPFDDRAVLAAASQEAA